MPRLVVVSRYLKSGNNKKLSNYVKYIATREGAATVKENSGTAPATEKQHELISSMLKDFPGSSSGFAYEAYKKEPTQKNASRFIDETLEHNADIIANKKNYIGYLANRPGAVKFGSHGLFSQTDEPINLNKVANAAKGVVLPNIERKPPNPLTDSQLIKFYDRIKAHEKGDIFKFVLLTGLRESEIIGLTVNCFDRDNKTLCVYRQLVYNNSKKKYEFTSLKNSRSRVLSLSQQAFDILDKYCPS